MALIWISIVEVHPFGHWFNFPVWIRYNCKFINTTTKWNVYKLICVVFKMFTPTLSPCDWPHYTAQSIATEKYCSAHLQYVLTSEYPGIKWIFHYCMQINIATHYCNLNNNNSRCRRFMNHYWIDKRARARKRETDRKKLWYRLRKKRQI